MHPWAAPTCNGDAQVPAGGRLRYRAHPDCVLLCIVAKNSDPQETLMEMHPLRNKDGGFSPTRPGLHAGGLRL